MAKSPFRFADATRLQDHFQKHGSEFGASSASRFELMASDFLSRAAGSAIHQKTRSNGDIILYNDVTQEFGILSAAGFIRTYFIPDPAVHGYPSNLDYFHAQ